MVKPGEINISFDTWPEKNKKIQIGIEKNICAFPNTPALPCESNGGPLTYIIYIRPTLQERNTDRCMHAMVICRHTLPLMDQIHIFHNGI